MSSATWALVASEGPGTVSCIAASSLRGSGTSIGRINEKFVTISMRCASLSQTLMRFPERVS